MSLFDDASLVISPNGVKAGKLYAVKPTDGSGDLTVTRATTATRVNSAGLIESVASNVPRLDYTNGTCPSILVEPQRTNLLLNSLLSGGGAAPTNWTSTIGTGSSFQIVSEKSSIGVAYRQVAVAQRPFIEQSRILAASTVYTASMIVEEVSGLKYNQILAINGITPSSYKINGLTVLSTATATKGKLEATFTTLGSGSIGMRCGIGGNGAATGTLTFSCPQLEAGSYATSYIPTTSASVTRNADVISKTGISSLIGQTEGTMFWDFYRIASVENNGIWLRFGSSLYDELIALYQFNTGEVRASIRKSATAQFIGTSSILSVGKHKAALAYKNNDFALYVDGVQIAVSSSGAIPTCDQIYLNGYPDGEIRAARTNAAILFKNRLSNTELATLTTI